MFRRLREGPPEAPVESVEPGVRPALQRAVTVGWLLDDSVGVPGTSRTFGVDSVVGLVPVVGDLFAAGISLYVVAEAVRTGAPRAVVGRMLFNLAADFLVGLIPVIGFVFDALWAANQRNAALLEDHLLERRAVDDAPAGGTAAGGAETGADSGVDRSEDEEVQAVDDATDAERAEDPAADDPEVDDPETSDAPAG